MIKNKKNKEIEKVIITNIKQEAKKQKFKIRSNCIYKIIEDYFIYASYKIQPGEEQWTLILRMKIKSYDYDNLFWEIFDMAENKNEPDSLRAVGAFSCPAFQWNKKSYEISSLESLKADIENAMNDFQNEINLFIDMVKLEYGDFHTFILSQNDMLLKMLANITKNNYALARELASSEIEKGERGGFANKGKYIYEYIIDYCDKQINH